MNRTVPPTFDSTGRSSPISEIIVPLVGTVRDLFHNIKLICLTPLVTALQWKTGIKFMYDVRLTFHERIGTGGRTGGFTRSVPDVHRIDIGGATRHQVRAGGRLADDLCDVSRLFGIRPPDVTHPATARVRSPSPSIHLKLTVIPVAPTGSMRWALTRSFDCVLTGSLPTHRSVRMPVRGWGEERWCSSAPAVPFGIVDPYP